MKEKIENVIKFIEEYVIECPITYGCGRCNEARQHVAALKKGLKDVNQEVEKRIAERMPSEEEINAAAIEYATIEVENEEGGIDKFVAPTAEMCLDGIEWLRNQITEKK